MASAWYPDHVTSAEDRLRYYSSFFNTVEVDSTFYGLPSERTAALWATRTPPGFTFHVKAFAMMTRHAARPEQLAPDMRTLDEYHLDRNGRIVHPSAAFRELVFRRFRRALDPLRSAHKLGVILLQFPPYLTAGTQSRNYIAQAVDWLRPDHAAVEFRHSSWLAEGEAPRTMQWLRELGASYVSVDEPRLQGHTVLPPVAVSTHAEISYVRLHGRNQATWNTRVASAAERFLYLYTEEELKEWIPKVKALSAASRETFVMFNNCYADYAPRNARQLMSLLDQTE
mgnify:CR=1 FL=1